MAGLLGGLAAQAQTYTTPVPATDPTPLYSGALGSAPGQRSAWVSQHLVGLSGTTIHLVLFTYDAAGRVASQTITDSLTGQPRQRLTNAYDARGKLVNRQLEQWTNGQPGPTILYDYAYDAQGNLTREATSAGLVMEHAYTYDAAGTITSYTQSGQAPGQAMRPGLRIQFTLRNGQWQSSTEEIYSNGAWRPNVAVHRFGWHNWPRRQLSGRRVSYFDNRAWPEQRDTVQYVSGPDSVSTVVTATPGNAGSWSFARQVRTSFDARRNRVATMQREILPNGSSFSTLLDSTSRTYDAQGQLRRLRYYTNTGATGIPTSNMYNIITQYYGPDVVTSTAQATTRLPLTLSPNPTTRQLTLTVPALPDAGPVHVDIVNALGQVVEQRRIRPQGGNLTETWNVQNWPAGLYVVRLRTAQGTSTQRFLKQ